MEISFLPCRIVVKFNDMVFFKALWKVRIPDKRKASLFFSLLVEKIILLKCHFGRPFQFNTFWHHLTFLHILGLLWAAREKMLTDLVPRDLPLLTEFGCNLGSWAWSLQGHSPISMLQILSLSQGQYILGIPKSSYSLKFTVRT